MPESLHSSYTKVKSANIQKPWTQLSRTGSLTSVGAHVEQLGASRGAQGFPRTLCPVPARARAASAGSPRGLLRVPALARRRVEQPEAPRADVDRSSGSGKMVQSPPGRTADLCVGCEIPLLLLLRAHRSGSPEYNPAGDAQWSGTSVSSLQRAASGSLLAPALPLLGGNWPSPQGRASQ